MSEHEDGVSHNPDNNIPPGIRTFLEKIYPAARQRFFTGLTREPDSADHPNQLTIMGLFWRKIREDIAGLNVKGAAVRTGIEWQDLSLFEGGYLNPHDYQDGFIESLAETYGFPQLAQLHHALFDSFQY